MTGWRVYNSSSFVVDNLTTDDGNKALSAKQGKALQDNKLESNEVGAANGVASLGADTRVPVSQLPPATISDAGVLRFATATEVANKTNASVAINPRAVVDMFVSQSNTEILPSGRIFKWGKTILIPDEGELIVDFPNGAFPNACYVVQLTENVKTTWANNASHVCAINQSRTGFTIYFNSTLSISTSVDWFAIGY